MIENLLIEKMPQYLKKKSIILAYLENGTYDQIVNHLEREIELNYREAKAPLIKTQRAVTKAENTKKTNEKPNKKSKTPTLKTVPNQTLENDQCRYCKEAGQMMTDCPQNS